jgi:2'-5' RNA ligase
MNIARRLRSYLRRARLLPGSHPAPRSTAAIVLPLGPASSNWVSRAQFETLRRNGANPGLEASPHVSLKLGFQVEELEPIAAYLERLSLEVEPIELALREVGVFEEGISFLDVVATPRLDRLRRRILRDLQDGFGVRPREIEGDQFRFHATISYGLPGPALAEELERLREERIQFHEICRSIELWVHTGTHWSCYRRAALSGRVAG